MRTLTRRDGARRPTRGKNRARRAPVPRRGRTASCARRDRHPLQHVLGSLRARRDDVRSCRREHARAPASGARRRGPARGARQRHQPVTRVSAAVLPRQGGDGSGRCRRRLSYAIVRPTLVFGPRDILVNNIAWGLRRSPVFPIAGDGSYRVQPVSVEDTAAICVDAAAREDDVVLDAAGPETISYASSSGWSLPPLARERGSSLAGPPRARPRARHGNDSS